MRGLLQDVRFAIRSLRRRRSFALVAIVTVALGIGAATSIYTVVDGVLLRPLPYRESGRLVAVWQTFPTWKKEPILAGMWDRIPLSIPEYRDVHDLTSVFENVGIWAPGAVTITEGDRPELVSTTRASASLLDVLGKRPLLGRMFLPSEDVPGGPRFVLVSYESWQSRFGGDRQILGRTVRLDDVPYTVIGVLPRGLSVGRQEASLLGAPVFWVPTGQDSMDYRERTNHSYRTVARLATGVSIEHARLETSRLLSDSTSGAKGVRLAGWEGDQVRDARAPLLALLGAAALLLGIACVNTATLSLGEVATRQEMATRLAIGAGRGRLVRQLLTESLLLSLAGGALGVLCAAGGTKTLIALAPPRIPGLADVHLDLRVLAVSLVAAIATGLCFGITPALVSAGAGPAALLRAGAGQSARGRGALQRGLVALELALSVVLLVGAGLLTRSLEKITAVDPGFHPDHLLAVRTSLPGPVARDSARVVRFYDGLAARLSAMPGVRAVTFGSQPPFNGGTSSSTVEREGAAAPSAGTGPPATRREAQQRIVVPGFFATLGIPLLGGREFSASDRAGAPDVAIVSDALARRDFSGESPLGKRVKFQSKWWMIVGIVGDVHYQRLTRDLEPTIYTSPAQRGGWSLQLLVRTAGDPTSLSSLVRAAIHDVEPRATVIAQDDMRTLIRRSSVDERYRTLLITLFGMLAILLAAIGIYGVTARAVARRTREVGIRLALGATTVRVVRLLVGHTLAGVAAGVAVGLIGALVVGRFLSPFLFGVDAMDPVTYAGIVSLLAIVSGAASWLPARRAGRLDVAGVLRGE
ncbi:MAG TPA: ABC transporter permease [Gemmatimonadaceae bacterium]|nr:ABC transporter permease [Gemmatimonadaceae bacterium]